MKILVLSFYYQPDLSAGSFRTTALASALIRLASPGSRIDVVTTLPNRYHSFSVEAPETERQDGLSVLRVALPRHESGMLDQAKAFAFFVCGVVRHVWGRDYDIVFATSSRLMTAVLGAWVARRTNAKLYLDMRDVLVDNMKYVAPRPASWVVRPVLSLLERWAINRADKVNLVSPGFAEYFTRRYPRQRFTYFTNGIDEEFIVVAQPSAAHAEVAPADRPVRVLYAGNVGDGQGLHAIVPQLAKKLGPRVDFKIIGDGGRKKTLAAALAALGSSNVELLPPVGRAALLQSYHDADVLFLHLNDYESFKTVLPSKVFEYGALGKPLWAGVAGYAAEFICAEIDNAAVFRPCNVDEAVRAFETLTLHDTPRPAFVAKFARSNITRQMAEDVLAVATAAG